MVLPITNGGEFAKKIGFAVPLTGAKTTGVVRYDQPGVLDIMARGGRNVESLPAGLLDEVLAITAVLFH